MDSRTKGILTIVGIAAFAAAGVAAGAALQHDSHPRQLLRRGGGRVGKYADRDALGNLLEKLLDALPKRDSERLMHRVQAKLKQLQP